MISKQRVKEMAIELELELNEWGEDGYWFRQDSAMIHISFSIINNKNKTEMVEVWCPVVRGARIDQTLMRKLLRLNSELNFGAFGLLDDDTITYQYSILGGNHMDSAEFKNAISMVAFISDEYDNKIVSTHGGTPSMEYVMEIIRKEEGHSLEW